MYHEFLQAEITKHKRYFNQDFLTHKKGEHPLKNRIEENDPKYNQVSGPVRQHGDEKFSRMKEKTNQLNFQLERENVYGFRTYDMREGMIMTKDKQIFYTSGSSIIGISTNPESKEGQRIFSHHLTAVSCFDLFEDEADNRMIVSSEMTYENNIIIWDPDTLTVKAIVKKIFERGISKIKFSNNGKYIAIVGVSQDSSQQIVVLSYSKIETFVKSGRKDDKIEAIAKVPSDPILDIVFDSQDQAVYFLAGTNLCTFHFKTSRQVDVANWGTWTPELLTCITYKRGKTIMTSSINGKICAWDGSLI